MGLYCRCRRERDPLCLGEPMLAPQVAVGFHCQRAAVFVSKPTGDGWYIHARFDAACRKQMSQIVMRDATRADLFARAIKRLLAFANTKDFRFQRLIPLFGSHPFKQRAGFGDHRNPAHLPIFRRRFGVASYHSFTALKNPDRAIPLARPRFYADR